MMVYQKISPSLSFRLNIVRATTAALVVVFHLRIGFFIESGKLLAVTPNLIFKFLIYLTLHGHEAVIIFFVLSGYFVGGSLLSDWFNEKVNYKKYFIDRITRMWTVLIPALIIGGCFDLTGLALNAHYYHSQNLHWNIFFGNMFFLQTILTPCFGSNLPLWTLANEFWYYMMWPVVLLIIGLKKSRIVKMIIMITLLGLLSLMIPDIMKHFPVWIGGAIVRLIGPFSILKQSLFHWFSYFLLLVAETISVKYSGIWSDYLLCISVAVLFLKWQHHPQQFHKNAGKIAHFFADFSFSLYAVHYFIIRLILEIDQRFFGLQMNLNRTNLLHWLQFTLIVFIVYSLAWIFYRFTEHNTWQIRIKTYSLLLK